MKRLLLIFTLVCAAGAQDYQPFLIAPLSTGKSIGLEPWLSPQDAFPTLINARVNKGVLEKRQGYQLFATMKHGAVEQSDTAIMGIHTYVKGGMPQLLIFDTTCVNKYNPVDESMTDITGVAGTDEWVGITSNNYYDKSAGSYLVNALNGSDPTYDTFFYWLNWNDDLPYWFILDLGSSKEVSQIRGRSNLGEDPTDVDIYVSDDTDDWGTAVEEEITTWQDTTDWVTIDTTDKIGRYVKIVVNDTENVAYDWLTWGFWKGEERSIIDVYCKAISFTGNNDDYFTFCNWLGTAYFTNNVDQIFQYNGSGNIQRFNVQINDDSEDNQVNTCRYIFIKNDRMLLLDTVELGDWKPQRCRYSPVLSTDFAASGAGYIDAPTEERIFSAGWVGKDIVVFFQGRYRGSLWRIRTTGNSDLPLKWEKVTDTIGSVAPYSCVEFSDGVAVIGLNNIIFYDGFRVEYLDLERVRDIVDDFDATKLKYSTAHNVVEEQHIYFTYTSDGESYPDRILDYNILEKNWAVHKYDVHCLGTFDDQKVPVWTEADDVFTADEALVSAMDFDSREIFGDPFPFTLMGTRTSKVYKLNTGDYDGTNDDDGTIDIDIRSSRWNPFLRQGKQAVIGNVYFLVDNDENASATVTLYKETRSTSSITRTLSCDSDDDGCDKFWVSMNFQGERADFFRLKISHDERGNRPRIHAIMPFFKMGGDLGS